MKDLINIENKDGQLVVSSREVAANFGKEHKNVIQTIENITAEKSALIGKMFIPSEYTAGTGKAYKEYLMTRDGFSLLVMGFTGGKALEWKLKYIDAFNAMEKRLSDMDELSPQLRVLINLEREQKQLQKEVAQVNQRVDGIKDIVGLSVIGWREDAKALIVRIADAWGGREFIADVNTAIYQELEKRLGVNLKQRRTNKRRRMAEEGASKTKQEKVSYVDIIADDRKLIEGYMAIVKEMAIKYGLADEKVVDKA